MKLSTFSSKSKNTPGHEATSWPPPPTLRTVFRTFFADIDNVFTCAPATLVLKSQTSSAWNPSSTRLRLAAAIVTGLPACPTLSSCRMTTHGVACAQVQLADRHVARSTLILAECHPRMQLCPMAWTPRLNVDSVGRPNPPNDPACNTRWRHGDEKGGRDWPADYHILTPRAHRPRGGVPAGAQKEIRPIREEVGAGTSTC